MAATYRVIAQTQSTELTRDGRFIDVMEITFEIPSGATGTVRIPVATYNAQTAAAELEQRAGAMIDVENL